VSKLLERRLFLYRMGFTYRIAFTNSAIFPVPFFVKCWMKALPMMAPVTNCVSCVNFSLLLIPEPITWGVFRFISEIRFLVAANPRLCTRDISRADHVGKAVRNTVYKIDALVRSLWCDKQYIYQSIFLSI
jgi:hypothetical protein